MKIRWFVFVLLFALDASAARAPSILVVGDSLSAGYGIELRDGWVTLLQQRLTRQGYPHTVVNASISGDTTAGGRARLPDALKRHRPQIVILELGGNDGLRGLSLRETRANLDAMIKAAQTAGAQVLLVGIHLPPNYGPDYTGKFHAIYHDLARIHNTALVPFLLDGVALTPGLMQPDGIHPRAAAQPRLLDNVWPSLEPLLKPEAAPVAQHNNE
ncbi:MAG: esterase [Proteobacteria bacterium]|nr:esterase [Pseudomonadota bacterium]